MNTLTISSEVGSGTQLRALTFLQYRCKIYASGLQKIREHWKLHRPGSVRGRKKGFKENDTE
jgi:hypothetical protein